MIVFDGAQGREGEPRIRRPADPCNRTSEPLSFRASFPGCIGIKARRETNMAVTGKLTVKRRSQQGSRECRRLRDQGLVAGDIYRHKQQGIPPSISSAPLVALRRGGATGRPPPYHG